VISRRFGASLVLIGLLAGGAGVGLAQTASPAVQTVRLTASKFEFSPEVVRVKRGQTVKFELDTADRRHGFIIPAMKVRATIQPDETASLTVTFNQAGKFRFNCDDFCGDGHEEMLGVIEVSE